MYAAPSLLNPSENRTRISLQNLTNKILVQYAGEFLNYIVLYPTFDRSDRNTANIPPEHLLLWV